jgi:hypothetical protein
MQSIQPIYPILDDLLSSINAIDTSLILCGYITGSIPLQDFLPEKSDIDFVILVDMLPDESIKTQLEKIHNHIHRKYGIPKLSGIYLAKEGLDFRNWKTTETLTYDGGRLRLKPFEMGPVTLFELKTTAITHSGTQAAELPVHISTTEVNQFISDNLNSYWKPWIKQQSFPGWRSSILILFPRLTEWVLLGIARQLYTLHTGVITSKTNAGHFILDHLPENFHPVIREAIDIRNDSRHHWSSVKSSYAIKPSILRAQSTLACARYMADRERREFVRGVNVRKSI